MYQPHQLLSTVSKISTGAADGLTLLNSFINHSLRAYLLCINCAQFNALLSTVQCCSTQLPGEFLWHCAYISVWRCISPEGILQLQEVSLEAALIFINPLLISLPCVCVCAGTLQSRLNLQNVFDAQLSIISKRGISEEFRVSAYIRVLHCCSSGDCCLDELAYESNFL